MQFYVFVHVCVCVCVYGCALCEPFLCECVNALACARAYACLLHAALVLRLHSAMYCARMHVVAAGDSPEARHDEKEGAEGREDIQGVACWHA